jgi:hypothetical protein
MDKILELKKLTDRTNLNLINKKLILKNCKTLYNIYKKIKPFWKKISSKHNFINKTTDTYNEIFNIFENSFIMEYKCVKNEISKIINIIKLENSNITFYYFNIGNYHNDIELINLLFSETVCLAKYSNVYERENIIVIWFPISKNRDFNYDIINDENLQKSADNFNAFTVSGLTYGNSPRITIITRYEEISKLLLHELIHNFNLDGSNFHKHNHLLIKNYKNIKNPKILSKQNYEYEYSIYESYTELLSSYLNIIFRHIELETSKILIQRYFIEILFEIFYSYNTVANLIILNGYSDYNEFIYKPIFKGNICIYEYYFLKALLYNNYELKLCYNETEFLNNYNDIINVNKQDPLLINIYNNMYKQTNFKYNLYD